ncbi:tetratricopeptide repeat protein [Sulfurimonas sp.]|uniref:tetratricopeptide repeat protein n=1 Tax=Sulfurimonas sp. TaxID=2022749 RepID=UPI0019DB691F|nr:tetratricopeptide repeat protein [Sulfurimonas sp.]MBE0515503.1 tetratricopeptide repeat protein [Sulfurimonas sp.]
MTLFQIIMLGASAFFAFKVYEHIQTLQNPKPKDDGHVPSSFDPESLVIRADGAFENGDLPKAIALFKEANAKVGQDSDILFKMGYILEQLGDRDEALGFYKEALEDDKNNEYIHNAIASIYRANGEFVSAKLHLNASLSINDNNPTTYYNYGNLLVDMKHFEEAKEMYKKAIEMNEDFKEAKEELEKLG